MTFLRAAIAIICLSGCTAIGRPRTVAPEGSTISWASDPYGDRPIDAGSAEMAAINFTTGTVGADPTTERVVGYVAIIGGVIAITIVTIGFYKLVRLVAH